MRESAELRRTSRAIYLTLLPLVASWLLAAAVPLVPQLAVAQTMSPEVPLVLTPGSAGEHVRSSVYYLLVIIGAALCCALPLEVAKFAAVRHRRAPLVYAALTLQQGLIAADVVRSYAWDWWVFLLSITHLQPIDGSTWMVRHPTTIGAWPWPSALSMIGVACILVLTRPARRRPSPTADQRSTSTTTNCSPVNAAPDEPRMT
jgi:hypothetical protein